MAKIAILNDSPEVVALLSYVLTPGEHQVMKMIDDTQYMVDRVGAYQPDLILLPLYRRPSSANRPIQAYQADIQGTEVLTRVSAAETLKHVPIVLIGFFTTLEDMPPEFRARIRFRDFLLFPDGLQELNPLISGLLGPSRAPNR